MDKVVFSKDEVEALRDLWLANAVGRPIKIAAPLLDPLVARGYVKIKQGADIVLTNSGRHAVAHMRELIAGNRPGGA